MKSRILYLLVSVFVIILIAVFVSNKFDKEKSINENKVVQDDLYKSDLKTNEKFLNFWNEFKRVSLKKDTLLLKGFVEIPFKDFYGEIYYPENTLTANTHSEFVEKFNQIFEPCVIEAIQNNSFRGYDENYSMSGDIISKEEYILLSDCSDRARDLVFKPTEESFILYGIVYFP